MIVIRTLSPGFYSSAHFRNCRFVGAFLHFVQVVWWLSVLRILALWLEEESYLHSLSRIDVREICDKAVLDVPTDLEVQIDRGGQIAFNRPAVIELSTIDHVLDLWGLGRIFEVSVVLEREQALATQNEIKAVSVSAADTINVSVAFLSEDFVRFVSITNLLSGLASELSVHTTSEYDAELLEIFLSDLEETADVQRIPWRDIFHKSSVDAEYWLDQLCHRLSSPVRRGPRTAYSHICTQASLRDFFSRVKSTRWFAYLDLLLGPVLTVLAMEVVLFGTILRMSAYMLLFTLSIFLLLRYSTFANIPRGRTLSRTDVVKFCCYSTSVLIVIEILLEFGVGQYNTFWMWFSIHMGWSSYLLRGLIAQPQEFTPASLTGVGWAFSYRPRISMGSRMSDSAPRVLKTSHFTLVLSWTAYAEAVGQTQCNDFAGYQIYVKGNSWDNFQSLGTVTSRSDIGMCHSLVPGTQYVFKVRAIDQLGRAVFLDSKESDPIWTRPIVGSFHDSWREQELDIIDWWSRQMMTGRTEHVGRA